MIKNLNINKNKNNINGIFSIGELRFFYKVLDTNEYCKELKGHDYLKEYYPVTKLIFNGKISDRKGVLIFEYEDSVDSTPGLLVDLFFNNRSFKDDQAIFFKIFNLYKRVFIKTIKKNNEISSDVFFRDRIMTRICAYYSDDFLNEYLNKEIKLNNFNIVLRPNKVIKSLKKYFKVRKNKWCVVSQCDPNDLNIGLKPIIFDYLAGGFNPIMAEFAVLFWYNLAQGSYLSPKYNNNLKEYIKRDRIDKVLLTGNAVNHVITQKRKDYILFYIDKVIAPVFDSIEEYENWYNDFKNYFAMKVLSVFDVSRMNKKDKLLSLGYLELFYNYLDIKNLKDLKEIVKKL